MKKASVMFGVVGLVVGLVIGFVGANSLNKSATGQVPTPAASTTSASGLANLPADHPPLGPGSGGEQLPQVVAAMEKAKQQPNDYEAQMTAADLYYQIQKFEDAAKFYEIANKLKPGETEPMVKAGNAYFDKAATASESGDKAESTPDFVKAEKWYLRVLQKDPKNIDVRIDLGLTFFLRTPSDIDRAIKEYKISLETDPNHEITLQNLVLAYTEKGDKEALAKTLDLLKKVNPNNSVLTKTEVGL